MNHDTVVRLGRVLPESSRLLEVQQRGNGTEYIFAHCTVTGVDEASRVVEEIRSRIGRALRVRDVVQVDVKSLHYIGRIEGFHRNPDGKGNGIARVRVLTAGNTWYKAGVVLDVRVIALTPLEES